MLATANNIAMTFKSHLESYKSHLDPSCEYELNTLSNSKVGTAKHHGQNYIQVKPPLVHHVLRNCLFIQLNFYGKFARPNILDKLNL